MIITKHYEVGITGKFQSRRLGTTLTVDSTVDPSFFANTFLEEAGRKLQELCVVAVNRDVKALEASDPNFIIIQAAAQEELDKYVKYLDNVKKAESKKGKIS
jgi:hypothetical protein